ncbi:MAG: DUF4861 domain-containing protein [Prevotella sp.]|nr:DUF4861 domain-containing protein [Prevotella sp.]
MNLKTLSTLVLWAFSTALFAQQSFNIEVTNPSKEARKDQPVVIQLDERNDIQSAIVMLQGQEIPCQLDDLNRDGIYDELCFLVDLDKKQTCEYSVTLYNIGEPRDYKARTYAELMLRNPKVKEKNKQDFYITELTVPKELEDPYHMVHHHGVAFENELIAVRIYFDQRQTLDLYGKYNKQLELKESQFYTTDDLKAKGYGDDVLWVGQTFGLGAFRGWDGKQPVHLTDVNQRTQRIIAQGPLRTIVEVEDRGWKAHPQLPRLNATLRYTLYAGHRDIDVDVFFNRDVQGIDFSTGLINVKNSKEYSDKQGVRGCWGTDFPAGAKDSIAHPRETVGLGIFIPEEYRRSEKPANKDNYTFVIGTRDNSLHYKLAYTSAKESFGFKNEKEWFRFLREWKKDIAESIIVKRITIDE